MKYIVRLVLEQPRSYIMWFVIRSVGCLRIVYAELSSHHDSDCYMSQQTCI